MPCVRQWRFASYERAAENFTTLVGVGISKSSLQRLVKLYGGDQVEKEKEEAKAMSAIPAKEEEVVWREQPEPDSEIMGVFFRWGSHSLTR